MTLWFYRKGHASLLTIVVYLMEHEVYILPLKQGILQLEGDMNE